VHPNPRRQSEILLGEGVTPLQQPADKPLLCVLAKDACTAPPLLPRPHPRWRGRSFVPGLAWSWGFPSGADDVQVPDAALLPGIGPPGSIRASELAGIVTMENSSSSCSRKSIPYWRAGWRSSPPPRLVSRPPLVERSPPITSGGTARRTTSHYASDKPHRSRFLRLLAETELPLPAAL
jgi:hypothetical protein